MSSDTNQSSPQATFPIPLRLTLGAAMVAVALALLIWTLLLLSVEYRYKRFVAPERLDRASLTPYVLLLEDLLKKDPTNGNIRNAYASTLTKIGEHPKALREAKRARLTQNEQTSLYFIATMLEKEGDLEAAEELMADCVIINPTNVQYNPIRLRLLFRRMKEIEKISREAFLRAQLTYNEASRNWAIRAPHDPNSHLFLANMYVKPLYPLQAYRCFLAGLQQHRFMSLDSTRQIDDKDALGTIRQIIRGHYAKSYRGLPGGIGQPKERPTQ